MKCSSYKFKQLHKSLNVFLNRFYLFKVNLVVHEAGWWLDKRKPMVTRRTWMLFSIAKFRRPNK